MNRIPERCWLLYAASRNTPEVQTSTGNEALFCQEVSYEDATGGQALAIPHNGNKIGKDGRARKSVGSTVNIEKASYTNSIGAPTLAAYWEDPDFDAQQDAFYYVRVLEIPTPRWTTHDAAFFQIKRPGNVPATIQDRAYTSPVWYAAK